MLLGPFLGPWRASMTAQQFSPPSDTTLSTRD
jgi:hypothetical protein